MHQRTWHEKKGGESTLGGGHCSKNLEKDSRIARDFFSAYKHEGKPGRGVRGKEKKPRTSA